LTQPPQAQQPLPLVYYRATAIQTGALRGEDRWIGGYIPSGWASVDSSIGRWAWESESSSGWLAVPLPRRIRVRFVGRTALLAARFAALDAAFSGIIGKNNARNIIIDSCLTSNAVLLRVHADKYR